MSDQKFYISTPIYYVNDKPHLGTAYSTIIADVLSRYHRFFGQESFLLTGVDEHGQKCEQVAKAKKINPQDHCDQMSQQFQTTWEFLQIQADVFLRTSSAKHKNLVKKLLQRLYDKGDIYSSTYQGWYCTSEEIFYTKKDLVDGKSPTGKEVTYLEEKNYFFKMSKYQEDLKKHLEAHPQFIRPNHRQNEIKSFLNKDLQDLCISRPKKRLSWGIELPFDKDYVAYVWVDALINYLTGIYYPEEQELEDSVGFQTWWKKAGANHLIGKDILMTHGIYWSCLLLALEIPLPKTIFAHGWLLNESQEKMSKSKGEKLDPIDLAKEFGVCELRYVLSREISLGQDSYIHRKLIIQRIHQDLSNQVGNMLSRLTRLIEKNYDGKVLDIKTLDSSLDHSALFKGKCEKLCSQVKTKIEDYQLSQALEEIMRLLTDLNRYLEEQAPWKMVKEDKDQAAIVLYNGLEVLRICGLLLFPVMPVKMTQLLDSLGEKPQFQNTKWGRLPLKESLTHHSGLFPKHSS